MLVRRECGESAEVGRFGGDQFAAVVWQGPAAVAHRILTAMAAELGLRASIGIALAGGRADAAALLIEALGGARTAKQAGGGRVA